jgi:hypothetical protein
VMAFAQLTWRESLRDIEVCLTSNQAKLFHMGLKNVPARSTLAQEECRARYAQIAKATQHRGRILWNADLRLCKSMRLYFRLA